MPSCVPSRGAQIERRPRVAPDPRQVLHLVFLRFVFRDAQANPRPPPAQPPDPSPPPPAGLGCSHVKTHARTLARAPACIQANASPGSAALSRAQSPGRPLIRADTWSESAGRARLRQGERIATRTSGLTRRRGLAGDLLGRGAGGGVPGQDREAHRLGAAHRPQVRHLHRWGAASRPDSDGVDSSSRPAGRTP